MSTGERVAAAVRLTEVAEILAAGLLRLRQKSLGGEAILLDFLPDQSVSPDRLRPRRKTR